MLSRKISCGSPIFLQEVEGTDRSLVYLSANVFVEGEKRERKKLEAVLKKGKALGGRPKAELDPEELRMLKEMGWSSRRIAEKLGVSHTTIIRKIKNLEEL